MNYCRFMRIAFVLLVCSTLAGLAYSVGLAGEIKAAQMSFQNVVRNSVRVKAWFEEIKKLQTEALAKTNLVVGEVAKLEQQLSKAQDNAEEKEKLETEIKKKREDLRHEQETAKVKVTFHQQNMQTVIKGQISEVVEILAKEEGYTMVISSDALYFSTDVPDITARVTKALDALPSPQHQVK